MDDLMARPLRSWPRFRIFGALRSDVVCTALLVGACQDRAGAGEPTGERTPLASDVVHSTQTSETSVSGPGGAPRRVFGEKERRLVETCREESPNLGNPGYAIDGDAAWQACMPAMGGDAGACDLSAILTVGAAVCVARGLGLVEDLKWRVRLQVLAQPFPRVVWSISLPDASQHLILDAHTGEEVAWIGKP
jgi:hypothetical protein